jgi:antitoxin FitA
MAARLDVAASLRIIGMQLLRTTREFGSLRARQVIVVREHYRIRHAPLSMIALLPELALSLQSSIHRNTWGAVMANLVVRNLDQRIVDALKQRAARHGRSAEAEHRALLEALLLRPKGKSFAEALAAMPNVGQDEDFERVDDEVGNAHVFG